MSTFISLLLILSVLVLSILLCYKVFLQCLVLKMSLPKPKKRKVQKPKKVVYDDELDD